jgi:pseudouridine synthase
MILPRTHQNVYLVMHKPSGYVTTAKDTHGRHTVMELVPDSLPAHVLPVGRLDRDTEGLLFFTNDGELAHRVTHPRYRIDKEYAALVTGDPSEDAIRALRSGIAIDGRPTAPAQVERSRPPHGFSDEPAHSWLRIVIHEGRKRQVRMMCAHVGHPVRTLVRTRIDGVLLGRLGRGETRPLRQEEINGLKSVVGLKERS